MTMEAYEQALKKMDWGFEFADDHRYYVAGRDALKALYEMQAVEDPDGTTWRRYARYNYQPRTTAQ